MHSKSTMTTGATGVSTWIDLRNCDGASITIVVPAGPNGTFTVEGTDAIEHVQGQKDRAEADTAPYADVTSFCDKSAALTPSGSAVNYVVRIFNPPTYLRLRFTRTSGSGTVKIYVKGMC